MVFKLRVPDIPPEGIDIPVTVAVEETGRLSEGALEVVQPVSGHLRVEPSLKRFLVRGRIQTVFRTNCARCLEEMNLEVSEDVVVVYTHAVSDEEREELEAEGLDFEFFIGEEIDLWPIIQEQLLLALPIKAVCDEECQGLCPVCGVNKNHHQCQCRPHMDHSGLEALMEIRDRLPKG
jgi:uncharacterized protein